MGGISASHVQDSMGGILGGYLPPTCSKIPWGVFWGDICLPRVARFHGGYSGGLSV